MLESIILFISSTDALAADDLQAFGIAGESIIGLILYLKIELSGKTHTAHHTERVIREGNIRGQAEWL